MPVIRISRSDLERLVGKKLSDEEIMYILPRIKCEIEVIEDDTIEFETTHDRPDLYSVEGVARAVRSFLNMGIPRYNYVDLGYKAYNKGVPRRPYVAFAVVRDLELDEEAVRQMMQLQEKLAITYGRRRRKASIGVYDLDKFEMPIYYELVDPEKIKLVPLEGKKELTLKEILSETEKGQEYGHLIASWEKYPVIRDANSKILSLPPIINGEETKVTVETKNILIDSTGTDLDIVIDMVTIMATSLAERSKTKTIAYVFTFMDKDKIVVAPRDKGPIINVSLEKARDILGVDLSLETSIELLSKSGIEARVQSDNALEVLVPPYRIDLKTEIDIIEELAIMYGLDSIGKDSYDIPPSKGPGRIHPIEFLSRKIRLITASYGFIEVANYMMSNYYMQSKVFGSDKPIIKVLNPKMEKYTGLRRWLTPGLVNIVKENQERESVIKIFEVGDVVLPDPESPTGAKIERRLGIAISHEKATLTDGLAYVHAILDRLGVTHKFEKGYVNGLLKQRTAFIVHNDRRIGFVGEVHPKTLKELGINRPVVVAEIYLNDLLDILR